MKSLIFLLLFIFLFSPCLAGTHRPDLPDSKFLEYGKKFLCVMPVMVEYTNDKDDVKGFASCVTINDHWCITAAHVVHGSSRVYVFIDGQKYLIDKAIVRKGFAMEKTDSNDIALLYSKKSFDKIYNPELYRKKDEVSKICTMAGFGYTGNFNTGVSLAHDFKKRGGTNKINRIENGMLVCDASKPGTSLEFLIAEGDSGGGLFIDGKLAGIASVVITNKNGPKGVYGDLAGFTRISSHIEWIEKHVNK